MTSALTPTLTDALPLAQTQSALVLPRLALAGCVRCVLMRNSVGLVLTDAQRLTYWAATPLCSLQWVFEGDGEQLPFPADAAHPASVSPIPGRLLLAGPQTLPTLSRTAPGGINAMLLLFLPEAFAAMTGVLPGAHLNRVVDAATALPPHWLAACEQALELGATDRALAWAHMERFIEGEWRQSPVQAVQAAQGRQRYADWAEALMLRAATSGVGRSLRQLERRIKASAGQSLRELRGVGRAERAYFDAMAQHGTNGLAIADVAATQGYADQAHLTRAVRRVSGFPPQELMRRIATQEAFWPYRLWQ